MHLFALYREKKFCDYLSLYIADKCILRLQCFLQPPFLAGYQMFCTLDKLTHGASFAACILLAEEGRSRMRLREGNSAKSYKRRPATILILTLPLLLVKHMCVRAWLSKSISKQLRNAMQQCYLQCYMEELRPEQRSYIAKIKVFSNK